MKSCYNKPTKILAFFLSVLLLFYAIPLAIFAEAADAMENSESDSVDASFPEVVLRTDEPQNEKVLPKNENVLAF